MQVKSFTGEPSTPDPTELALLSKQVAAWLDPEDPEKVELALDGLDVTIFAGGGEPHAIGHLPVHATYSSNKHADVCSMVSTKRGFPFSWSFPIPLNATVPL